METAENRIEVPWSVEEAQRRWHEFIGAAGDQQVTGDQTSEAVPTEQLPGDGPNADKGTIFFSAVGPRRTQVTMQLRYNARALSDAGLDRDWITRRIRMYLERYKQSAGATRVA